MTQIQRQRSGDLTKYDPDKGIKSIRIYEAAEKYYRKARDIDRLEKAIRAKLEAQAEFVLWWDTTAEKSVGAAEKRRNRSVTALVAGENGLPDRTTISRWRRKLGTPEGFELACEEAIAKNRRWLEGGDPGAHVGQNTGDTEWFTPKPILEAARDVLGEIDVDPASTVAANRIVQAKTFYTAKQDGLKQSWAGRVWMNPPYAGELVERFSQAYVQKVSEGEITAGIVLVNNATETNWFSLLVSVSEAVCFPTGRVKFWHPNKNEATPLQGQALLAAGGIGSAFLDRFRSIGWVAEIR